MRSLRAARFVVAFLACVAALSAPLTAVAHGMAHQQERQADSFAADATQEQNAATASAADADLDHSAVHRVPSARQLERQGIVVAIAPYRLPQATSAVRSLDVPPRDTVGEPIPPPLARAARPRPPPVG